MKTDFKVGFGKLVLVENPGTIKTSISLNHAGGCHFFLLDTQEIVVRSSWVGNVPFTSTIVDRLNEIARSDPSKTDPTEEIRGRKSGSRINQRHSEALLISAYPRISQGEKSFAPQTPPRVALDSPAVSRDQEAREHGDSLDASGTGEREFYPPSPNHHEDDPDTLPVLGVQPRTKTGPVYPDKDKKGLVTQTVEKPSK
jgi:hypothetical protein